MNKHRYNEDSDKDNYNITSWGDELQGRFKIDNEDNETFMDLYKNAIEEGASLSILERPTEYGPIVIDIDIKTATADYETPPARLYNEEDIKKY